MTVAYWEEFQPINTAFLPQWRVLNLARFDAVPYLFDILHTVVQIFSAGYNHVIKTSMVQNK